MPKKRLLVLTASVMFLLVGISPAEVPYTWHHVVDRGMPNFNDPAVSHEAFMVTSPVTLSFPSGVEAVFVFVYHEDQTYGVYHDQLTGDVVGILRADMDPYSPQGLRFYDFYVDTGLLTGHLLTGEFLHLQGKNRIFMAVCRIADLSKEARAHSRCPISA